MAASAALRNSGSPTGGGGIGVSSSPRRIVGAPYGLPVVWPAGGVIAPTPLPADCAVAVCSGTGAETSRPASAGLPRTSFGRPGSSGAGLAGGGAISVAAFAMAASVDSLPVVSLLGASLFTVCDAPASPDCALVAGPPDLFSQYTFTAVRKPSTSCGPSTDNWSPGSNFSILNNSPFL